MNHRFSVRLPSRAAYQLVSIAIAATTAWCSIASAQPARRDQAAAAAAAATVALPAAAGAALPPVTTNPALSAPGSVSGVAVVLNSRDATVSLIDMASYSEIGRVPVGKEPHHLYPTPDGKQLIVANAISNDLDLLDPLTGKALARVRNIDDPYQISFSPDRKWFGVNALRLDRVDLYHYDGSEMKLAKRVPLSKAPSHLWFSSDSKWLYVTLQESDEVAAIDIDRQEVAWRMKIGKQPAGILVTPDDKYLMVGVMGEDYVLVIDPVTRTEVTRIVTGKGAHNFRGLGDKRHVFVSNRVDNTISKIDMTTMKVVDTIVVAGGPDCIEVTADGKQLWVTSRWAKRISIVDLDQRKVVRQIPVGRSPHGIFFANRAPLL